MRSTIVLTLVLLGFSACQKDNSEVTLLTFTQDASSSTAFSDDWIFVTSERGEELDIKQFEAGATIVLKSNKVTASDKINVTIFHYLQPNTETIDFTSYLGITPNQNWVYNKINGFNPTVTGSATFNVTGIAAPSSLGITASTNFSSASTRISSPTSITKNLYKPSERLFVIHNKGGTPSYFEASNVKNGDIVTANYGSDFKPLQNIFTVDLSGSDGFDGTVHGITNESGIDPALIQGYLNYEFHSFGPYSSTPWGYNSGFDLYRIKMGKSLTSSKMEWQYFKLGASVTSIPFPTNTFTLSNGSLNGFSFSLTGNFHVRNSRWTVAVPAYNSVLSWRIYSPIDGKQVFTKIPDKIKNLYPALPFESLALKSNAFTIYLDDFTYSDFINGQMNISSSKKSYSNEYQTVFIQN